MRRIWAFIWQAAAIVLLWFLSNFFYSIFWKAVEEKFGFPESLMLDAAFRYGRPLVPPILLLAVLWIMHFRSGASAAVNAPSAGNPKTQYLRDIDSELTSAFLTAAIKSAWAMSLSVKRCTSSKQSLHYSPKVAVGEDHTQCQPEFGKSPASFFVPI
jgi:hypothetical protein